MTNEISTLSKIKDLILNVSHDEILEDAKKWE